MPELPDVEFNRRRLDRALSGATIASASSKDRLILRPHSASAFTRALVGRRVKEVSRRGKWLRIVLDDGGRFFSHLGMTGWWVERSVDSPVERSERARIDLTRDRQVDSSLRYVDSRRFGRLVVANDDIAEWRTLGPDPLEHGIDVGKLAAAFARSRRAVKDAIMDQTLLAGIGNILATEGLWRARIDPRSPSDALSRADVGVIVRGIRKEIRDELAVRTAAEGDEWRDHFSVYGHAGEPCPRCGTRVSSVVIGGRTSAFCKGCQAYRRRKKTR